MVSFRHRPSPSRQRLNFCMLDALVLTGALLQAPVPQRDSAALEGEWTVNVIDNINVMPAAPVTITFRGTRVSGLASCNTYIGAYTVAGTSLKTESILTTMKACDGPRMSQERDFLTVLRSVERYELRADGVLRLVTADGKAITATRK
jgi:heat shock protein HslJ